MATDETTTTEMDETELARMKETAIRKVIALDPAKNHVGLIFAASDGVALVECKSEEKMVEAWNAHLDNPIVGAYRTATHPIEGDDQSESREFAAIGCPFYIVAHGDKVVVWSDGEVIETIART